MGIFKSKEQKEQEKLQEKQRQEEIKQINAEIQKIVVSTIGSYHKPFEVIGVVASKDYNSKEPFSTFIDELKTEAHKLHADMVIGLIFQTVGTPDLYTTSALSIAKSRAVGTAIRFVEN